MQLGGEKHQSVLSYWGAFPWLLCFFAHSALSDDIQSMSVFAVILPKASLVFAEVIVHVQQPDGDNMSNTWTLKTITLSFYAA